MLRLAESFGSRARVRTELRCLGFCLGWLAAVSAFAADSGMPPRPADPAREPVHRALVQLIEWDRQTPRTDSGLSAVVRLGQAGQQYIDRSVRDYACLLVKREQIEGKLSDDEFAAVKIRHAHRAGARTVPFGVYLKFLRPTRIQGREVLFVSGQNDDRLIFRKGGPRLSSFSRALNPTSPLALSGSRYPVTDIGLSNLVGRLLVAARDLKKCEVHCYPGASIDGRQATRVEIINLDRTSPVEFCRANLYIDHELLLPVRYESYDWPVQPRDEPELLEQYTYLRLTLNPGFSDADFDLATYGLRPPADRAALRDK